MFLDVNMPLYDSYICFDVGEENCGISIEFESDKLAYMNFMVYGPDEWLVGQHMGCEFKGSIWMGPEKKYSSAYSLPLRKPGRYKIFNVLTSTKGLESDEIRGKISFYEDENDYMESFLKENKPSPYPSLTEDNGELRLAYEKDEGQAKSSGKKWYKGDLHCHTVFSDGQATREELNQVSKEFKLDYVFPSDHLVFPYEWPLDKDLLILPAMEITSIFGHFNNFFAPSAYIKGPLKDYSNKENVIEILEKTEGLLVLNHPFRGKQGMKLENFSLDKLDGIEIINSPLSKKADLANIRASQAWSDLWNMGYDLFGTGGSDCHARLKRFNKEYGDYVRVGMPQTYIHSRGLSGPGLKEAMENKEISFALRGRPSLVFSGSEINGAWAGKSAIGQRVDLEEVDLVFSLEEYKEDYGEDRLSHEWIVDGKIAYIEKGTSSSKSFTREEAHWIRVDLRDKDQRLLGSVNPLRLKENEKIGQTWADLEAYKKDIGAIIFDINGTLISYIDGFDLGKKKLKPRTDLRNLFEQLRYKGLKIGIVTSFDQNLLGKILADLDIWDLVDFYYGSRPGFEKPDPRILLEIERDQGILMEEMAYVGDSSIDMRLAFYCQLSLAIRSKVSSPYLSYLADKEIENLDELISLF